MKKQIIYSLIVFLFLFFSAWFIHEQDVKRKNMSTVPSPASDEFGLQISSKKNSIQSQKTRFGPREYVKLKSPDQ